MTFENLNEENELKRAVRRAYDVPMPAKAQVKLEEAYTSLRGVPQERAETEKQASVGANARPCATSAAEAPSATHECAQPVQRPNPTRRNKATRASQQDKTAKAGKRVVKRSAVVAIAAAFVVLLGGTAFAASSLLQMKPGEVPFFQSGSNLPIYNSLQAGVASLNTEVGQSAVLDDVTVTFDTVSTDRNIINLFFTLEKEGGFDLAAESSYEGSNENEWTRLQRIMPRFSRAQVTSAGELLCESDVNRLDAYLEGDKVKCLMRIVPGVVLPDEVGLVLNGMDKPPVEDGEWVERALFEVGLDLSTVVQPKELGEQDLVFATSEGDKTMGIKRFTTSELGTVMVVRNDNAMTGEPGVEGFSYGPSENVMPHQALKVYDDQGNILTPVNAGDGSGYSLNDDWVVEFAGVSPDAQSVTFTPMLPAFDWQTASVDERQARNESGEEQVDVSQIGTKLATSEFGGYELTGWEVSNNTVSISLKPYGWQAMGGYMELIPQQEVSYLASEFTNPDGQSGIGYHSAVVYRKWDYMTGNLMQMTSYYAATDEELRGLTQYSYRSAFGEYVEDTGAAKTVSLTAGA